MQNLIAQNHQAQVETKSVSLHCQRTLNNVLYLKLNDQYSGITHSTLHVKRLRYIALTYG